MNFKDLENKVCVITGGNGVLGQALVEALANAKVKTAIIARRKDVTEEIARKISKESGTEVIGIQGDVLDKNSLIAAKKEINEKLGKVDLLINAAGGNSPDATTKVETLEESDNIDDGFFGMNIEGFKSVFDLNITGTVLPSMIFCKDMVDKKCGAVVNLSSMSAYKPLTKIPAYSASKAGINNFTEWLAVHLAKSGIRVNAIAPGFFLTNQNRFLLTDEKTGDLTSRGNKIIEGTPMGRFGNPEEIQGTTLFLLSELSQFITGVIIPIDGGFNAYSGV